MVVQLFGQDLEEMSPIVVVDESVVEHSDGLVGKKTSRRLPGYDHSVIRLEQSRYYLE